MWQNLSLRGRINLLLALLLALGLAVNIGRQVAEAGPRVQAEDHSVIRLAREFIEMIVADLKEAPDPDARLNQIARDLSRLRHVSIALPPHVVLTAEMTEPTSTGMPISRALLGSAPSARERESTTRTPAPASFSTIAVW